MASPEHTARRGVSRRGAPIHGHPDVTVETERRSESCVVVSYRGPEAAIVALGLVTAELIAPRSRKGRPCALRRDIHGAEFRCDRYYRKGADGLAPVPTVAVAHYVLPAELLRYPGAAADDRVRVAEAEAREARSQELLRERAQLEEQELDEGRREWDIRQQREVEELHRIPDIEQRVLAAWRAADDGQKATIVRILRLYADFTPEPEPPKRGLRLVTVDGKVLR